MCFYLARCFVNMTFMTRSEHPNKAHCIPYRGERTDNTTTADTSTRRHDDGEFGEALPPRTRRRATHTTLLLLYTRASVSRSRRIARKKLSTSVKPARSPRRHLLFSGRRLRLVKQHERLRGEHARLRDGFHGRVVAKKPSAPPFDVRDVMATLQHAAVHDDGV